MNLSKGFICTFEAFSTNKEANAKSIMTGKPVALHNLIWKPLYLLALGSKSKIEGDKFCP